MSVDAPSFGSAGEGATTPRFQLVISAASPGDLGSCSAAFWIILEKLGFLDFELIDLESYEKRRDELALHVGILTAPVVARLDETRLAKLLESPVPLLIEGPWDASLDPPMGVELLRDEPAVTDKACWAARWLEERLDRFLDGIACPSSSRAYRTGEPLLVSARSTREQRQSEHESRFAGVNDEADAPSWKVIAGRALEGFDFEVLLSETRSDAGPDPARALLLERGSLLVSTWPILSFLAQDYTAPYERHRYSFSRDRYPLELLVVSVLLRSLASAARASGLDEERSQAVAGARLSPWPRAAQWALTVRHDVDRVPSPSAVETLIDAEREAEAGVSCYFLSTTAHEDTIRRFAAARAEIAYHSMHLEPEATREMAAIRAHSSEPIAGSTVHGTKGFYGWRGAANWEVARELGFLYAEHLNASRYLPSRVFRFENGTIAPYDLVALPHHVSIDRDAKSAYVEENRAAIERMAANQMHVILMNHPDINIDATIELLSSVPAGAIGMTNAEVARWWRSTHFREAFSYEIGGASGERLAFILRASSAIEGLTMEIPGPAGVSRVELDGQALPRAQWRRFERSTVSEGGTRVWLDLPAGDHRLEISWGAVAPPTADETMRALRAGILDWFARDQGKPTRTAERTADFNSTGVEGRVNALLSPLLKSLEDPVPRTVLDVGCGFGGLALYLASRYPHVGVEAIDLSPRFYSVAERTAADLGLTNVRFRASNILELSERDRFDIVMLSNMLCFLTSRRDLQRACENALNAVRPGGMIAIYTPHAGSFKEPFTGLPAIHWLPGSLREWIVVRSKRRSTLRDVRLPWMGELERIFVRLGAKEVHWRHQRRGPAFRSTHVHGWVVR